MKLNLGDSLRNHLSHLQGKVLGTAMLVTRFFCKIQAATSPTPPCPFLASSVAPECESEKGFHNGVLPWLLDPPFQITHAEIFPPFETEVNEGIGNKHTGCIKHVRAMFAVGNDEHVCSLAFNALAAFF